MSNKLCRRPWLFGEVVFMVFMCILIAIAIFME